ncbi:MAG: C40 family peptidase [Paeniclostridium sp.]
MKQKILQIVLLIILAIQQHQLVSGILCKIILGKPYVWEHNHDSFDCSGFTYYVFKNSANITLPRTSKDQSTYGTTISKKI